MKNECFRGEDRESCRSGDADGKLRVSAVQSWSCHEVLGTDGKKRRSSIATIHVNAVLNPSSKLCVRRCRYPS